MYHEYILKEMSNGRIAEARRQAAADSVCRQQRNPNGKGEHRPGGAVRKLAEGLVRMLNRRSAAAHG